MLTALISRLDAALDRGDRISWDRTLAYLRAELAAEAENSCRSGVDIIPE